MGFLTGKRALIVGLASSRSIAHGIAEALSEQGAELAFSYQNDRLKDRVVKMGKALGAEHFFPCDVSSDEEISAMFTGLAEHWDKLDILVHSVAYAPADQLTGNYAESVNREGFKIAHDISSYSLAALTQAALPMMEAGSNVLTVTYQGSVRTIPHYNTMGVAKASLEANVRYLAHALGPRGIRVNAVSAGPIRTLAASGIKSFRSMLDVDKQINPLRQNTTIEQVGGASAFLCSDLAGGVTGEILHVDNGFHMVGLGDALLNLDTEESS